MIEIGWGSPGIKDWDRCATCGLTQEEGAHLVSATATGGILGHLENGQFKEGWTVLPTAYKCPDTPGVVTFSFTADDDAILADDPPNTREIKITVWDFTIDDLSEWLPQWYQLLGIPLKIEPAQGNDGNSLASTINCSLTSSQEPGVCKNRAIESMLNDPISGELKKDAWEYVWDYGAFGHIIAKAYNERLGGQITARVKDKTNEFSLPLPRDNDGNHISDKWEYNQGNATGDEDNNPTNPHNGDGLSRYEEYRGFFVNGAYIRTNPNKEDVFIFDENGLGIGCFTQTGLSIHLNPETNDSHLVTCYDDTGKLSYNQYYIRLRAVWDEIFYPSGARACGKTDYFLKINEDPLCRIDLAHIQELYPQDPDTARLWVIAHELGHAVTDYTECTGVCVMNQSPPPGVIPSVYCDSCKNRVQLHP